MKGPATPIAIDTATATATGEHEETAFTCCGEHGDSASNECCWLLAVKDINFEIIMPAGMKLKVPSDRVARTTGLDVHITTHPPQEEGRVTIPLALVCRLHQHERCKYNNDCKHIHICRGFFRAKLPPIPKPVRQPGKGKKQKQEQPPASAYPLSMTSRLGQLPQGPGFQPLNDSPPALPVCVPLVTLWNDDIDDDSDVDVNDFDDDHYENQYDAQVGLTSTPDTDCGFDFDFDFGFDNVDLSTLSRVLDPLWADDDLTSDTTDGNPHVPLWPFPESLEPSVPVNSTIDAELLSSLGLTVPEVNGPVMKCSLPPPPQVQPRKNVAPLPVTVRLSNSLQTPAPGHAAAGVEEFIVWCDNDSTLLDVRVQLGNCSAGMAAWSKHRQAPAHARGYRFWCAGHPVSPQDEVRVPVCAALSAEAVLTAIAL